MQKMKKVVLRAEVFHGIGFASHTCTGDFSWEQSEKVNLFLALLVSHLQCPQINKAQINKPAHSKVHITVLCIFEETGGSFFTNFR